MKKSNKVMLAIESATTYVIDGPYKKSNPYPVFISRVNERWSDASRRAWVVSPAAMASLRWWAKTLPQFKSVPAFSAAAVDMVASAGSEAIANAPQSVTMLP